jgi:hypothetical protein
MQLTMTDVDRGDVAGAALQQDLREAAGRGAEIERLGAGESRPKASSAAISLSAARET